VGTLFIGICFFVRCEVCSQCKGDGEIGSLEVARYLSACVFSIVGVS